MADAGGSGGTATARLGGEQHDQPDALAHPHSVSARCHLPAAKVARPHDGNPFQFLAKHRFALENTRRDASTVNGEAEAAPHMATGFQGQEPGTQELSSPRQYSSVT